MGQTSRNPGAIALSIVAPCRNEEANIAALCARISAAVRAEVGENFEIVLVNDGSTDHTWREIKAANAADGHVRGVNLSRNYGHQLALTAGLAAARGARIMMVDADLQDPPELIGEMMAALDDGADVAYGQRRQRAGETLFKRASADLFYRAISALSDFALPRNTGDFRLITRRVLDDFLAMPERHRFVRGMIAWVGYRQVAVPYDRDARQMGATKYTLAKMLRFAMDAVTSFSTAPLRIAGMMSLFAFFIAGLAIAYVFYGVIAGDTAPGWASVLTAVSFFSGAQLLSTAIIGEYLGRLYMESKGRPLFLVAETTDEAAAADSSSSEVDWDQIREALTGPLPAAPSGERRAG
ncbi:MAG TPA: glycosyltransferase family 2 protein [Parvularculaceae bacterium]|nr:glycosyltransferase family 2 protein [Parvularculaceae bacterium]